MFNCHRVFRFGRLWAIVGTEAHADALISSMIANWSHVLNADSFRIEPAFIEGAGF